MPAPMWMRFDPDLGAIWFETADQAALTDQLCAALGADIAARKFITWVERVDMLTEEGPIVLFNDEDGASHIELPELDMPSRERIATRLRAAGLWKLIEE